MKKKVISILVIACMLITMMVGCGKADSTSTESKGQVSTEEPESSGVDTANAEYVLRIGTMTAGKHPQNIWMEAYEKALEEKTEGRIDVQLYPAGQIGNMAELIQGLIDGTVDATVCPTTYICNTYMGAGVIDLPYLFEDSQQAYEILINNETLYTEAFEENGIVPITYLRLLERQVLSNEEVKSLEDFASLKLWSLPSPVVQKEVELMGATISNIDTGELAPSLQNGTVDGALTDLALINSQSLYTSASYLLQAPNDAMVSMFAISPTCWAKFPEDLQQMIKDVAVQVSSDVENPYVEEMNKNVLQAMEGEGLIVSQPSTELDGELREKLDGVTDWFLDAYPEYQEIYDELEALVQENK